MAKYFFIPCLVLTFAVGLIIGRGHPVVQPAEAASINPTAGYTLHVDAEKHFGDAHPTEIAHHWCKPVPGMAAECLIFDSDSADARLVEVETIVSPAVYKSFSPQEQALWHWHKTEIPKVNAKLPDLTPAEAAKVVASITDTYGKVWMLWDPMDNPNPVGNPTVVVLK